MKSKWLEIVIHHPKNEHEAIELFKQKVREQFHLILCGNPAILLQGNLFDKEGDCIVGCKVKKYIRKEK